MDAFAYERSLRLRLFAVIAAATACGGVADVGDAGDGGGDEWCNSCFCGAPMPQGPSYDVAYSDCDEDAGSDADADAAPPVCYGSCFQACEESSPVPPYQGAGQGLCVSQTDDDAGNHVAHCQYNYLCGRRFDGLEEADCGASLGETLARMAWLEAASIHAFRRLARELRAHGAPEELVAAARACARDESRHARVMARLARAHGAKVPRVEARAMGVRDLESIARENAVEACVGETYGALLAMWQAEHAGDEDVRAAMRAIAPDELRHAALGWAVAAWADARLEHDARARVAAARSRAVRDLLQNTHIEPTPSVARATGAPSAPDQARLAAAMRDEVWSATI